MFDRAPPTSVAEGSDLHPGTLECSDMLSVASGHGGNHATEHESLSTIRVLKAQDVCRHYGRLDVALWIFRPIQVFVSLWLGAFDTQK